MDFSTAMGNQVSEQKKYPMTLQGGPWRKCELHQTSISETNFLCKRDFLIPISNQPTKRED